MPTEAQYRADPERYRAYQRAYRARNLERVRALERERRRARIERVRAQDRARYPRRKDQRLRKLGISLREYEELCAAQDGACSICGRDDQPLMVDHCHASGKFRSLLCRSCNSLLGWYERYEDKINGILKRNPQWHQTS